MGLAGQTNVASTLLCSKRAAILLYLDCDYNVTESIKFFLLLLNG